MPVAAIIYVIIGLLNDVKWWRIGAPLLLLVAVAEMALGRPR
jgi:hypothetical protein